MAGEGGWCWLRPTCLGVLSYDVSAFLTVGYSEYEFETLVDESFLLQAPPCRLLQGSLVASRPSCPLPLALCTGSPLCLPHPGLARLFLTPQISTEMSFPRRSLPSPPGGVGPPPPSPSLPHCCPHHSAEQWFVSAFPMLTPLGQELCLSFPSVTPWWLRG